MMNDNIILGHHITPSYLKSLVCLAPETTHLERFKGIHSA